MQENNLKLSDSKKEFMVLASNRQLTQVNHVTIQVQLGAKTISAAVSIKNVGTTMEATIEIME